jgi:hypothetical protein
VASIVALSVTNSLDAACAGAPQQPQSPLLQKLMPLVQRALPKGHGAVIVRSDSSFSGYDRGAVLWLERSGVKALVEGRDAAAEYADRRVYHGGSVRATIAVGIDDSFDELLAQPDMRLVAYRSTLTPRDRAALKGPISALDARHRAGLIGSVDYYRRLKQLERPLGHAVGFFLQGQ